MADLQIQLTQLRRRMTAAARRADRLVAARPPAAPPGPPLEACLPGGEVESLSGRHWEAERLWERWRRHGNVEISGLRDLPSDLLVEISGGEVPAAPPESWAFLDTETTGLAGGSGTCAFLIGVGRITSEGFRVRQFFMRDFAEETSVLAGLTECLAGAEALVTYNGKAFDLPLLETRYRIARLTSPLPWLPHLDLLHGARRLWRLRLESCRLVELENQILGHLRQDDVPGELIPQIYFDYVRSRSPARLAPIFVHNALDIVSLACLAAIVPWAFRDPVQAPLSHGAEMVSLGRWLRAAGRPEQALELFRRAVDRALGDGLLFRTLWDIAALERKLGRPEAALAVYTELAQCRNPHRVAALEELAKHYEHRERNYSMALEFTQAALELAPSEALRRRVARLKRLGATPGMFNP